jgi:hypothetical protein
VGIRRPSRRLWRLPYIVIPLALAACSEPVTRLDSGTGGATRPLYLHQVTAPDSTALALRDPWIADAGSSGEVVAASGVTSLLPVEFSVAGGGVRSVGQLGTGPGQIDLVVNVSFKADSAVVLDRSGRISVYDPNGEYVRTLRQVVDGFCQILFLRGDTIAVFKPILTPARFGFPIHLIAPNGDTVRSFGSDDRSVEALFMVPQFLAVSRENDSSFWVAHRDKYVVELWATSGLLLKRLTLTRSWFPQMTKAAFNLAAERPQTEIAAIHRADNGHLVVLINRARSDWRATRALTNEEPPVLLPSDHAKYLEQVVEVLDSATGRLEASTVSRGRYMTRIMQSGDFLGFREGPKRVQLPVILRLAGSSTTRGEVK